MEQQDVMREYDALKKKLQHYEIILAQTENVLFSWDYVNDIVSVSDTWETLFGYPPVCGRIHDKLTKGGLFHPEDIPLVLDRIGEMKNGSGYEQFEIRLGTIQKNYLWCRVRATAVREPDGSLKSVLGIIINIDAEKREEQLLQERAERDPLTKLLNKTTARNRAEEYLRQFWGRAECALYIIDLDNFKQINDRFGHLYGDSVLTKVAREIGKLFRPQDIVARIGGDEFMVLMRGTSDRHLIENRCSRLLEGFATAFLEENCDISCSIGVAMAPQHGKTYVELFQKADQALYCAKAQGKNTCVIYSKERDQQDRGRIRQTMVSGRIDSDEHPDLTIDRIFQYAFQKLYASRNVDASISELLALMGKRTGVSRVYIFESSEDNRSCSNTYEWCNSGITSVIRNLQNLSYERDLPGYEQNFDESDIFCCSDVRYLPEQLRATVERQGVRSLLHCAMRENGVFRGCIGFEDCLENRMWTKQQIDLLKDFTGMLSVFLLRLRSQEQSRQRSRELLSVMDSRNTWIYVLDPDTFQIRYRNEKVYEETGAQPGMLCYQALMGRQTRCPGCPAEGIREKKRSSAILHIPDSDRRRLVDSDMILWKGEEACIMTSRDLPEEEPGSC